MAPPSHVTVLGAGLTGLTTAYRLSTRLPSTKITLIDSASRAGGWINSQSHRLSLPDSQASVSSTTSSSFASEKATRTGDVVIESGPRSIRPRGSPGAAGMLKLILDLGLKDDIIAIPKTHPSAKNRYILGKDNKLRPLSLNLFHSALKPSTLFSASLEPFRRRRPNAPESDESVDSFLRRRFGPGVAELASAGLHGIYAASSADLSAVAVLGRLYDWETQYGSVISGLMRNGRSEKAKREKAEEAARWETLGAIGKEREAWAMYGLRGGLGTLTDGLKRAVEASGVDLRLDTAVRDMNLTRHGVELKLDSETITTSHVISSLAPPSLAPLIPDIIFPDSPRTSVGVVSLVFPVPPSQIHPEGFGYLIPRPSDPSTNPSGILGVVFDSTALPGLDSIEGVTKLTIMMGGPYWSSYHPTIPRPASGDDLVPLALEHVRTVFPAIRDLEPALVLSSLHKDCIPTYTTGHAARTRALHQQLVISPWNGRLSLVGNAFAGVGVNDCVWSAEQTVAALVEERSATGLEAWATSTPEQIS